MILPPKRLAATVWLVGCLCGILSRASGATVQVNLTWGAGFGANDSSGNSLSTSDTSLKLGFFQQEPTNWSTINRSNIDSNFTTVSTLSYTGPAKSYVFSLNTDVAAGVVTPADPYLEVRAYLVVTSGSSQLGIYDWYKSQTSSYFTLPRDPNAASDPVSVSMIVGNSRFFSLVALEGAVSSNGLTTLSAPGSQAANQSISSFPTIPSKTVGETFGLTASATSGLAVTYSTSNTNVATVSGNLVTIIGPGTVSITASQAGNSSYLATSASQSFVAYSSTALQLSALGTPVLTNNVTTVTHTFVGNPNATYTIEYKKDFSDANWATVVSQTGTNGVFNATFNASGDYVNAWKNRMFFRAKNS